MKPHKIFVLLILFAIIISSGFLSTENDFSRFRRQKLNSAAIKSATDESGVIYSLNRGVLTVSRPERTIWSSPGQWWIDNFVLADSNGDGLNELNLSVWKSGDFGASRPFWVKANDPRVKNHFFVMRMEGEKIIPLWQSSNLEKPNLDFTFRDVDGDGNQELIALEGDYGGSKNKTLALWRWNGWGFTNDWRGRPGNYDSWRLGGAYIISK